MRMENQVIDLRLWGHSTGYLQEQRSSMTRPLIVVEGTGVEPATPTLRT